MIKSLTTEYGLPWIVNRSLYSFKLKMMKAIPNSEKLFEKEVQVKRIDLFDIDTKPIEGFLSKLSEEKQHEIIGIADRAIKGKIKAFSSIELDYGSPINWHFNPVTGKEVDSSLKWYEIPDFDPVRGDIKLVWEASRFTHLFYFSRAYMITKDKKYYEAFSTQLDSWLKENPYSFGANYKCGQEATLRMINVLIAYSVFNHYGLVNKNVKSNVIRLVDGSYKKVISNFFYAHKCIKNNHTLSEITGLIIGAWACYDEKRLKKAYHLLDKEIQKQFFSDGGYIQYSFNYQRFALQMMEFVLKISNKTKLEVSNKSKELIKKSAYLLYQMQDDEGDVPNYGSNDGALIFPVTSCDYRDFRPVINTLFFIIDKIRVYEKGVYDEEVLWFGDEIEELPFEKLERISSTFNESGFYSLRHNNGFLMTVLQNFQTRPAQMDQLHIDLWHRGINVLCDSGTYSYADDIGKKLTLTSAHNTVAFQEKEQMNKYGPFFIYNWTTRSEVTTNSHSFIGTMKSRNGYTHTRNITKHKLGYSISDKVSGDGEFCYFYFHTPCDVNIFKGGFELVHNGEIVCSVKTKAPKSLEKSYRSLYYYKKEEINCVVVKGVLKNHHCEMNFDIELK